MTDKLPDPMWTQAQVSDLDRRLGMVERFVLGQIQEPPHHQLLVSLYLDSLRGPAFDEISARHWERQLFVLDSRQLLILARILRDPFPWRPFLRNTDLYIAEGYDLVEVRDHLLGAAKDLLRIQGLSRIQPRDVMGHPIPDLSRFSTISS